jgi:SAM-dependent methyltransferase
MTENLSNPPPDLAFYHTVEYAPGQWTKGWPVVVPIVNMIIDAMRRLDFRGKRVLDIGCRDGALSFTAEKLGAASVLGVDFDLPHETIAFLKPALRSQVRFEKQNLYDLKPETHGQFDIVLLPGVVYHLRYPFLGLRLMRDLVRDGGILLVETATFTDANRLPLLLCPIGADSPYEPTSCTFFNVKGFVDTAGSLGFTVADRSSLLNLPVHDPDSAAPLPIDRTVFTCIRDRHLDDPVVMAYWDGLSDARKTPPWKSAGPGTAS